MVCGSLPQQEDGQGFITMKSAVVCANELSSVGYEEAMRENLGRYLDIFRHLYFLLLRLGIRHGFRV